MSQQCCDWWSDPLPQRNNLVESETLCYWKQQCFLLFFCFRNRTTIVKSKRCNRRTVVVVVVKSKRCCRFAAAIAAAVDVNKGVKNWRRERRNTKRELRWNRKAVSRATWKEQISQAVQTYRVLIRIERDRRREELTWTLTWRIKDVHVNMNVDVKNRRRERRREE